MFRYLGRLHPALYMMISVAAFSAVPVLLELGDAKDSPFLFTAIWKGSIGLGLGIVVLLLKRDFLFEPAVTQDIWSHSKSWLMLVSIVGHCGFVLFTLGLVFVDVSVAAILFETWPLILILLMSFLFLDKGTEEGAQRYRPITAGTLIFVFLAIAGVTLVILSHNDHPHPLLEIGADFSDPGTLLGASLVMIAAICSAADRGCTLKIGILLAKKHSDTESRETREIVFALVITCICEVIAGCVLGAIGLSLSETISLHQLYYAVLGSLSVVSIGVVAFRAANLSTDDLGVNALSFAIPLITLIWLWMLSILHVSHLDYLIIGAMGIVASNLLINAEESSRAAYKALVLSLWVFGTVIYFTQGSATDVPLELPVTIFILVLAFRVDRLVRRTSEEEGWMFEVFHKLRCLAAEPASAVHRGKRLEADGHQHQEASKAMLEASNILLEIDRHKTTSKLTTEYIKLVKQLEIASMNRSVADKITDIRHLVDKLAHSRQQGSRFGEIVAIAMTGGLIVFGLLFYNGGRGFYGEITSFVLSSVVVFLFFNILDLQNDRRDRILTDEDKRYVGHHIVKFDDVADRKGQQWISVVTSAVIVVVFAWLFKGA